jgi:hypothetical protein
MFVSKHEIKQLLGVCDRTLERYRKNHWHEGIHYVKPVQKILYNRPLIEDWMVNRHDWRAHDRAIEAFQDSLLSNQKRKRA